MHHNCGCGASFRRNISGSSHKRNEKNNDYIIKIENETVAHNLLNELVKDGIEINKFEIKKPTLNDIFIEKVGE